MVTVANVIDAPTSSTSSTIRERFSPSGLSHRSVRSRPATTTRDPFDSDPATFSANCRQQLQSRKVGSPSRHAPVSRSNVRGVDATVNRATATPAAVNRNSGSSTRFPITVNGRSLRIAESLSHTTDTPSAVTRRPATTRAPRSPRRIVPPCEEHLAVTASRPVPAKPALRGSGASRRTLTTSRALSSNWACAVVKPALFPARRPQSVASVSLADEGVVGVARTWLSIRVELVSGHGGDLWPRPGRVFAAARSHSFAQFATAIDPAFARWDLAHLHLFTLSDGSRVSPLQWWDGEAPDNTVDGHATKLSRLEAGEQFAYVFDMGDDWAHLCTVADRRIDPADELGETSDRPTPLMGLGKPSGPVRTPLGRRRRRVPHAETPGPRTQRPAADPALVGRTSPTMSPTGRREEVLPDEYKPGHRDIPACDAEEK